jgi:ER lumen protein retaining receptor
MDDLVHGKKNGVNFVEQTHDIAILAGFLTISFVMYMLFSSGDFSFLLTYSSLIKCFGFGLLNYRMWSTYSAHGVSLKTLQLYAFIFLLRLIAISRHQGYLPLDKTGDWLYHAIEGISLSFCVLAISGIVLLSDMKKTYQDIYDQFGNLYVSNTLGGLYIAVPCIILAIICHPILNKEFYSDVCWTFSMYLEALAIIPQIYMFQKQAKNQEGIVEPLIGHTVFALGFSRLFELIFWFGSFLELEDNFGSNVPGFIVLLSQLGHVTIMGDFFYYYFKAIQKGLPIQIPLKYYSCNDV